MEKRLQCSECDKYFTKACNLKRHYGTQHPGVPYILKKNIIKRKFGVAVPLPTKLEVPPRLEPVEKQPQLYLNHSDGKDVTAKQENIEENIPTKMVTVISESPNLQISICELLTALEVSGTTMYQCKACEYTLQEISEAEKHINDTHVKLKSIVSKRKFSDLEIKEIHDRITWHDSLKFRPSSQPSVSVDLSNTKAPSFLSCPYCEVGYPRLADLRSHLILHFKPYQSAICSFSSEFMSEFQRHIEDEHENEVCDLCNHIESTNEDLVSHENDSHGATPVIFQCATCERLYHTEWELKIHNIIYHGKIARIRESSAILTYNEWKEYEGRKSYLCPHCEFSAFYIHNLKSHLPRHFKPTQCLICTRKFRTYDSMEYHMRSFHERSRCPHCEYIGGMETIQDHIQDVHENGPKVKCGECLADFTLEIDLKVHAIIRHSNILQRGIESPVQLPQPKKGGKKALPKKAYTCKYCTWTGDSNYHIHLLQQHVKGFECSICTHTVNHKSTLETHGRTAHGHIMCKTCLTMFVDEEILKRHQQMIHDNPMIPTRFPCSYCDNCFQARPSYELHNILHHQKDLMECTRCTFRTTNQVIMDRHLEKCCKPSTSRMTTNEILYKILKNEQFV